LSWLSLPLVREVGERVKNAYHPSRHYVALLGVVGQTIPSSARDPSGSAQPKTRL
jgi:hypothetical protein